MKTNTLSKCWSLFSGTIGRAAVLAVLGLFPACGGETEIMPTELAGTVDEEHSQTQQQLVSSTATATKNPMNQGPRSCPGRAVVRPLQNRCEYPSDLSPRVGAGGIFNGALDRPNSLPVGASTLQVCYLYIYDNGEGDGWPHGPHGNIHYDFFDANEPLDRSADGADRRRITAPGIMRGPHRTHGDTDEWLDDEGLWYQNFGLFNWDPANRVGSNRLILVTAPRKQVVMRLWESDSLPWGGNTEDGSWGRRNNVIGMERIDRALTERPGGLWVRLHKYTNDHPRRRTNELSGWALVKTGGSCL